MSTVNKSASETKLSIILAARELIAIKGFESVTMREIAAKAGCSHTAIYMYFRDKMSLLEVISIPVLQQVYDQLADIVQDNSRSSRERLHDLARHFVSFGIAHRSMYPIYFTVESTRVDMADPGHELGRLRYQMFDLFRTAVAAALDLDQPQSEQALDAARIVFYQWHGAIMTYHGNKESAESVLERVLPLVEQSVEALLRGLPETL